MRFAVGRQLEERDGALFLAERRPADEDHVVELLEPDGAVDAQVGPRAGRQRAFEDDVDADRSVGRGGIDARDLALDDAVARVDFGDLADPDVLGLRFRDPQLGLEDRRVGDARQVGAGLHTAAPHFDRHHLQHAVHARLHLQIVELAQAQLVGGTALVDVGFLRRELRLHAGFR